MIRVHLDVETRSEAEIKRGAQFYAMHQSTRILCLSYVIGRDPEPVLWLPGDKMPTIFHNLVDIRFIAWNAEFEIAIFEHVMAQHGFPAIPDEQWQCSMSDALALGLPGSLDQCGEALAPLELQFRKDPKGKNLITKLCKPKKPTKNSPGIWREKDDFLEDYLALYEYCRQDVRTERAIYDILPHHATE